MSRKTCIITAIMQRITLRDIKNTYHKGQGIAANLRYGFPGRKMNIIGVTGTDGKTTTASMIYAVLARAGFKAALISTVSAIIDGASYDTGFHVTTPGAFPLQRYLALAKRHGVTHLVLEVTSHGLDQARVYGIPFSIGVITNVSHEHLDYHKTYEAYVKAKTKLLLASKLAVVNQDDMSYPLISQILAARSRRYPPPILTYGMETGDFNKKNTNFVLHVPGKFNIYNALAAWAVCRSLGVSAEIIREALKTYFLPVGRGEIVYDEKFTIMIDFAHTPKALAEILSTIKNDLHPVGRIIHVFGSAGERDRTKRPLMGMASATYADHVILTAEDPRREAVGSINSEIKSGMPRDRLVKQSVIVEEVNDRQRAIDAAVAMAKPGDFIVITGKGHEKSMNFGKGETHWSDHKAVIKALEKRKACSR